MTKATMIPSMAIRNLWRNPRRTLITVFSIAFGVWLASLFIGTRQSTYARLVDASARSYAGHLTIAPPDFLDAPQGKRIINATEIEAHIRDLDGIEALVTRLSGSITVNSTAGGTGAAFLAIDPHKESAATSLALEGIEAGEMFSASDRTACLIGATMASRLGLGVGSKLVYTAADATGSWTTHLAYVHGIFSTGSPELDGHLLILPLEATRQALGYQSDAASFVAIYPSIEVSLEKLQEALVAAGIPAHMKLFQWRQTQADLANYIRMDEVMYRLLLGFIAVIVASGIFSTMLMNVIERRREFGVMAALGTSPARLFGLIITETAVIGILGVLAGTIVTVPFYLYLNHFGIDLTHLIRSKINAGGVVIDLVLHCQLALSQVGIILGSLFLLTLTAGALPATFAALAVPVKTIKDA